MRENFASCGATSRRFDSRERGIDNAKSTSFIVRHSTNQGMTVCGAEFTSSMRTLIAEEPFAELRSERAPWEGEGSWPCLWIGGAGTGTPLVAAYRRRFRLEQAATVRVHVSADERYELFLDGERIGRGSERGDRSHWFFETYDLPLAPGDHVVVGRVWSLGELAPVAQFSVRHGFILAPDDPAFVPLLGTGVAMWERKKLDGFEFVSFTKVEGAGAKVVIDGARLSWDFATGGGDGWQPAVTLGAGASATWRNDYGAVHLMMPATLPPMVETWRSGGVVKLVARADFIDTGAQAITSGDHLAEESAGWTELMAGRGALVVPARTTRRVLVDLEDYVCAYPEMVTSGGSGSLIRVYWAEALVSQPGGEKGNRDQIEGKFFEGVGDTFKPDGGASRKFETLWWEAGRYLEVVVQTADAPLTIESFALRETRYPLAMESAFAASDSRLSRTVPLMLRSLQMCAHETYMDCPFYEQLMYAGDTRTEALTTYAITRDTRLPHKALSLFAASRLPSGLTQSRYPSRGTQIIPPFALWWVAMVYDYALWRGDVEFVSELMPVVRSVVDRYLDSLNADGLVQSPPGWNFMDWVDGWRFGVPPEGDGVSGVINLQCVLVLTLVEKLEIFCGRPELAAQARRFAQELSSRSEAVFWNDERGLFADDLAGQRFSEHAQCLAVLGGLIGTDKRMRIARGLTGATDLARTSIYFMHYLFDTFCALGKIEALLARIDFWFNLEKQGFKTTPETADPCRSECHAWGAHPLYHYFASILGIRPAAMGFSSVRIAPQLGSLKNASGRLVHPLGEIEVEFESDEQRLTGAITLPSGLPGVFVCGETTLPMYEGRQMVEAAI